MNCTDKNKQKNKNGTKKLVELTEFDTELIYERSENFVIPEPIKSDNIEKTINWEDDHRLGKTVIRI